jgi:hypothetical protein
MQITHKNASSKPTSGSQQDLYQMCISLYAKAVLFGWKNEFYKAAFLANLKTFRLHEQENKSFLDYVNTYFRISETSAKRYVRIGKRLAELAVSDLTRTDNEPIFLTEEILESILSEVANAGKITVRGLDKATSDLATFKQYLDGEIDDNALSISNAKVKALTASEKETVTTVVNSQGHLIHIDEEPFLIEKEPSAPQGQSVKVEPYLEVWSRMERLLATLPANLWEVIQSHGADYVEMKDKNGELYRKVGVKYKVIINLLEQSKRMISALHLRDLREVKATNEEFT